MKPETYTWCYDEQVGQPEESLDVALESAACHFAHDADEGETTLFGVALGRVRWLDPFQDGSWARLPQRLMEELLERLNEDVELSAMLEMDAFDIKGPVGDAEKALEALLEVWVRAYVKSCIYTMADGDERHDLHLVIRGGELVAYRWGERQWPSNVP